MRSAAGADGASVMGISIGSAAAGADGASVMGISIIYAAGASVVESSLRITYASVVARNMERIRVANFISVVLCFDLIN